MSGAFQKKHVGLALGVGLECVTVSPGAEHSISFVSFASVPLVPLNVPTGAVLPTTLICRRMPLNDCPFTHTEIYKAHDRTTQIQTRSNKYEPTLVSYYCIIYFFEYNLCCHIKVSHKGVGKVYYLTFV